MKEHHWFGLGCLSALLAIVGSLMTWVPLPYGRQMVGVGFILVVVCWIGSESCSE